MAYGDEYFDRLAVIQTHLRKDGKVMVVTYIGGTIYDKRHVNKFSANTTGVYVRRGKSKECLNLSPIKFSRLNEKE